MDSLNSSPTMFSAAVPHSPPQTFDLYYFDGLAHQDEEIRLTVDPRKHLADSVDAVRIARHVGGGAVRPLCICLLV